jgi:RNA ligase
MLFDNEWFELLNKMIEERFVSVQKHPEADYYIYNYTQNAQFDRVWNDVTKTCRGLILDENHNIIARPFSKFFNYSEIPLNEIPTGHFTFTDKYDGSLGIQYWYNDFPYIATRGSFISDQSIHANKILKEKIINNPEILNKFDKTKTYLFEIIYPENRIVVDYKGLDDLILLAAIDKTTGKDCPLEDVGFKTPQQYDGKDIELLKEIQNDNAEGFVIKFDNDFRVKLKFEEYVRLHRILTRVSNVSIWECLSINDTETLDRMIDKVPDEFYEYVKKTISELNIKYGEIENICKKDMSDAPINFETRKDWALYITQKQYPSVLFNMLDKKDYSSIIWKSIRSKYSKPFKEDEE